MHWGECSIFRKLSWSCSIMFFFLAPEGSQAVDTKWSGQTRPYQIRPPLIPQLSAWNCRFHSFTSQHAKLIWLQGLKLAETPSHLSQSDGGQITFHHKQTAPRFVCDLTQTTSSKGSQSGASRTAVFRLARPNWTEFSFACLTDSVCNHIRLYGTQQSPVCFLLRWWFAAVLSWALLDWQVSWT